MTFVFDILTKIKNDLADLPRPSEGKIIPSERFHYYLPYRRNDTNIFFSAITLFLLQQNENLYNADELNVYKDIKKTIHNAYPHYKNEKNNLTYNFWIRNPPLYFPNGCLLRRFKKFQIPDDSDVTAMVYLSNDCDYETAKALKDKLAEHANLSINQTKHSLKKYRKLKAYGTWFGTVNMPLEFDVCVMSNIMLFVAKNRFEPNIHDTDTLKIISDVIVNQEYFKNPFIISPSYPFSAIILYHFARLVFFHRDYFENKVHEKLISDIKLAYENEKSGFNKMLLESSLLKLNCKIPCTSKNSILDNNERFSFFLAGMLSNIHSKFLRQLAPFRFFHIPYNCHSYNLALSMENKLLIERFNLG